MRFVLLVSISLKKLLFTASSLLTIAGIVVGGLMTLAVLGCIIWSALKLFVQVPNVLSRKCLADKKKVRPANSAEPTSKSRLSKESVKDSRSHQRYFRFYQIKGRFPSNEPTENEAEGGKKSASGEPAKKVISFIRK